MLRRPPISTRTDTLFPYTTLFRSIVARSPPVSTGAQTYCNLTYPTKWSRLVPVDMAFAVASCWPIALCISGGLDPFERAEEICLSRYFRSAEHTSELQSLMRISYAVFCLKKKQSTYYTTYAQ